MLCFPFFVIFGYILSDMDKDFILNIFGIKNKNIKVIPVEEAEQNNNSNTSNSFLSSKF